MTITEKQASLQAVMPFFIVDSLAATLEFYTKQLGFQIQFVAPEPKPFVAIVKRDDVALMLKEITPDIHPIPNHTRHKWARWDAYIYSPDPDALFKEFQDRNIEFYQPIADTSDGLRTFEIKDNNNYVLCFGRPQ